MKQFPEKIIVLTGASSGAGRAMANALAAKKCTLVLAARREKALNEVADECRALGATVKVVVTDVRKSPDVLILAKEAASVNGTIDVWINNAGVLAAGELEKIPATINENVILTNLVGYINGASQVLPYFKNQGYGTLINNISVGGWFPSPYAAAYTASKFGIRGFSESLKGELSGFPNIQVVDLYPGFLDTPGIQHSANYTGKALKPAPPVYDPIRVAKVVCDMINSPQSIKTIGCASTFLRLSYNYLPAISRSVTSTFINKYLQQANDIEHTPGNVLDAVEYGTGIYGGWKRKLQPKKSTIGLAALGMFALIMIMSKAK